jgi:uncharacterized protein (TIGR00730 family)
MTEVVAVFGSSRIEPDSPPYREGVQLGTLLAQAGMAVATGGYGGAMEAVSRGAGEVGGRVIGVTAPTVFPHRPRHNAWVTEEVPAETISDRIHRLIDLADGFVALPGSLGTFTELIVAWNDRHVAPMASQAPKPLVVVGDGWVRLVAAVSAGLGLVDSGIQATGDASAAAAAIVSALRATEVPREGSDR